MHRPAWAARSKLWSRTAVRGALCAPPCGALVGPSRGSARRRGTDCEPPRPEMRTSAFARMQNRWFGLRPMGASNVPLTRLAALRERPLPGWPWPCVRVPWSPGGTLIGSFSPRRARPAALEGAVISRSRGGAVSATNSRSAPLTISGYLLAHSHRSGTSQTSGESLSDSASGCAADRDSVMTLSNQQDGLGDDNITGAKDTLSLAPPRKSITANRPRDMGFLQAGNERLRPMVTLMCTSTVLVAISRRWRERLDV